MWKSLVKDLSEKASDKRIIAIAKDAQEYNEQYGDNVELFEADFNHQEDIGKYKIINSYQLK